MFRRIKKFLFAFLAIILFFLLLLLAFSYYVPLGISNSIQWGVAFSKPFAIDMGLNWREAYLAILDELKPKSLRLPIYWQDIEPQKGNYIFDDYDWLVQEAERRNIKLILVIGRKLPRWPECHLPDWAFNVDEKSQQKIILDLIFRIVERYKNYDNFLIWQVENEPFLPYGECPILDVDFLDKEIELVHRLDEKHPIMITDSGELSVWFKAAKRADIFGTTVYRIVWHKYFGRIKYPLPPKFFWLKANLVHLFYSGKPIIVSELQAEPWGPKLNYQLSLEEQMKLMSLTQFYDNIKYAKDIGFPEVYLWGTEWWYWMKQKGYPEYWEYIKTLN